MLIVCFLIWVILFVAKITDRINWSWWIINIPLYPLILAFAFEIFAIISVLIGIGIIIAYI